MQDLKNYTDSELTNELRARGYEVFNKDYATDYLWTLDDAIDAYHVVKNRHFTEDELTHEQLMGIVNETISSAHVTEMINEELERNIYENLFED